MPLHLLDERLRLCSNRRAALAEEEAHLLAAESAYRQRGEQPDLPDATLVRCRVCRVAGSFLPVKVPSLGKAELELVAEMEDVVPKNDELAKGVEARPSLRTRRMKGRTA